MHFKKYIPLGALMGIWGTFGAIADTTRFLFKYKDNIIISYSFVYSGLMAVGAVTLIYVLSELIPWIYKKIKSLKVEPDTSIKEALEYITRDSCFGKSLLSNQHGRDDAIKALKTCIFNKKIYLYGTNDYNPIPSKISLKELTNENLEITYVADRYETSFIDVSYVSQGKEKDVLYRNLLIPLVQLKRQFPHRHAVYRK